MTGNEMGPLVREDIRAVLASFGVSSAFRAIDVDPSEEVFLLASPDFERLDPDRVALAIMRVLPNTKVWVTEVHPAWETEPL
ncbi:hypothetical protein [Nocardioides jishulii]|uniref:Uncharacterized protein n=1 Tax=Nocardioides jishulii TaxID=2575440 RepID=A0A4U2YTF2_9ACTN|nr:hypothetical protein [Nocardioides jishulii]QCX26274.1 hypothetical protein FCL41_01000 [Nocardioides jishulii]TKI63922.1 hypothetical protein FC770_01705 [Nocardioides jishulii]